MGRPAKLLQDLARDFVLSKDNGLFKLISCETFENAVRYDQVTGLQRQVVEPFPLKRFPLLNPAWLTKDPGPRFLHPSAQGPSPPLCPSMVAQHRSRTNAR